MSNVIEISMMNAQNADGQGLQDFFSSVGSVSLKREDSGVKTDFGIVQVVIGIVGSWAAERYILDPLADQLQNWVNTVSSLDGKHFKVSVRFQGGKPVEFDTLELSHPALIIEIWRIIKSASDILASKMMLEDIDRIHIVPHREHNPLIIVYKKNRPFFILDIPQKRILPIRDESKTGRSRSRAFVEIEQLALRLERIRTASNGPKNSIGDLELEIDKRMSDWL